MTPALARLTSVSLGGLGALAGIGGWWLLAAQLPHPEGTSSMAVRIGLALAALLPAAALLLAMTLASSAARFVFVAFDPLAGAEPRFVARNQRVIANTGEQFAVFAPALLAWAAGGGAVAMPFVLAACLVFATARLLFWAGYHLHPFARAPGMAATFAINALAIVMAARAWAGL
jgi:uncharacterized membrane protein YecN with MAPEG domain